MFRTRTVPSRRGLNLMQLEDRAVPAGNITAMLGDSWSGPALFIEGDDLANSVVLTGKGDGVVEVRGINTTVNGGSKVVTFTGCANVAAILGDGDDTFRSSNLSFRGTDPDSFASVAVYSGAGDDTIRVTGTTAIDSSLFIDVLSDEQEDGVDGDDRIDITGTTAQGRLMGISVYTDGIDIGVAGRDEISITNTHHSYTSTEPGDYGIFGIFVWSGYFGPNDWSDHITVDQFTVDLSADQVYGFWDVFTGWSNDQIRLSNIDIHFEAQSYYSLDAFIGSEHSDFAGSGFGGVDSLELRNVNLTATVQAGEGSGSYAWLSFGSELMDVSNVNMQTDGWLALFFYTERADIRNVELTSHHDTTGVGVVALGAGFDESAFDSTEFRLTNVHVAGNPDVGPTGISIYVNESVPNRVDLVNCSADQLFGGTFYGSAGDDEMSVTNCSFDEVFVDLGDGNDTLTLQNNSFGTLVADLGDGDDTATLINNTATDSISVNGGDGTDTLIAWLNIAPFVDFDNFEL